MNSRIGECSQSISNVKSKEEQEICYEGTYQCCFPFCGFTASSTAMNEHINEKHSLQVFGVIAKLQDELKKKQLKLEIQREKLAALEIKADAITRTTLGYELATMQGIEPRVRTPGNSICKIQPLFVHQLNRELNHEVSPLAGCLEEVTAAQETATAHATGSEMLPLCRQELQDVNLTDGVFIWKVSDIETLHRNAVYNRTPSLYSPPFLTSPHGYRSCLEAYLNGYGPGWGTHISVFFVLTRTEHDDTLSWPFPYQVTLTLINQDAHPSESISESFTPSSRGSAFQQPTSEMNVAKGFPCFASQSVLTNDSFTKGNTILIKCHVSRNKVKID